MKFYCLQQDIISAIQTVQKVSYKNPSEIHRYIYIEARRNSIKIVAAGAEQTVITQIPCDVQRDGMVLAPLSVLRDIISKMPDVAINFEVNDRLLMTVSYIHMKYTIQCMPASAFSYTEEIAEELRFSMKTSDFRTCIKQTYFTASLQDTRPILSGILLKCSNGYLDFVSTDGTRVALRTIRLSENISFEIIIPAKFVFDIIHSSNIYDDDETIITFNQKYIKIKTGNTTLITGLINGKFINYRNIIPSDAGTVMTCDRTSFLDILERAFLLSDESLYTVKFEIKYSKLFVSSVSEAGQAFEEIIVQTQGNPITIAFNSKNFIEILRNIDYDLLLFEFTTGTRICKITPVECSDLLYLISPIRI